MGEDIFNFVLSDIGGIPALPVFIGNYLLDLLSTFFPIFMLLSAFVMVYIGLTRGSGDWKQTGQQIAPTAVSMAVIMGLLSMKTPYSSDNGGTLAGDFWKETNSYTVVEMMNTFLGFGNIFADALTHKIIYGSINVSSSTGTNSYNGYFPAVLQAMIDKDKSDEIKKFLTDIAKRPDIIKEIESSNAGLAAQTTTIVQNLHNLGIVYDYRKIRAISENAGDSIGAYKYLETKNYIDYWMGWNSGYGVLHYTRAPMPGEVDKEDIAKIESISEEKEIKPDEFKGYAFKRDVGSFKFNINDFIGKSFTSTGETGFDGVGSLMDPDTGVYTLDINDTLSQYTGVGVGEIISGPNDTETFAYLNKNNLIQEMNMIKATEVMLANYKKVYEEYFKEMEKLKNTDFEKESDKILIKNTLENYDSQMKSLRGHIEQIAALHKDYAAIYKKISGETYSSVDASSSINAVLGANFYENMPLNTIFSIDEINSVYEKNANLQISKIPWFEFGSESARKNGEKIIPELNKLMRNKAYITNVMYDKFKDILKDDTLFQTKMSFGSQSAYTRVFLPENSQRALAKLDQDKKAITDKYLDEVSQKPNVAKALEAEIKKQYTTTEFGRGEIIHWTDLGKNYATFKNVFSPMITNIYALEKVNNIDYVKVASMAQFMEELEPSAKVERLITATSLYAGGSLALEGAKMLQKGNIAKNAADQVKDKDSSSFSSFWDIIKVVGGMYFAILFVNVILPAFIWMFVIISYYIEMSIYVAVFPIGFMFMIFQSYRQSLHQYINMLLGFILMPIVLVSMYFVVLYIDMLLPMFFKQFLPFFGSYNEMGSAFSLAFGGADNVLTEVMSSIISTGKSTIELVTTETNLVSTIGNFIYTFLSMLMSVLLLLTFFRANEYMSKILNVTTVGMDSFQGKETLNKFGGFDKSGLTASVAGR